MIVDDKEINAVRTPELFYLWILCVNCDCTSCENSTFANSVIIVCDSSIVIPLVVLQLLLNLRICFPCDWLLSVWIALPLPAKVTILTQENRTGNRLLRTRCVSRESTIPWICYEITISTKFHSRNKRFLQTFQISLDKEIRWFFCLKVSLQKYQS